MGHTVVQRGNHLVRGFYTVLQNPSGELQAMSLAGNSSVNRLGISSINNRMCLTEMTLCQKRWYRE